MPESGIKLMIMADLRVQGMNPGLRLDAQHGLTSLMPVPRTPARVARDSMIMMAAAGPRAGY